MKLIYLFSFPPRMFFLKNEKVQLAFVLNSSLHILTSNFNPLAHANVGKPPQGKENLSQIYQETKTLILYLFSYIFFFYASVNHLTTFFPPANQAVSFFFFKTNKEFFPTFKLGIIIVFFFFFEKSIIQIIQISNRLIIA